MNTRRAACLLLLASCAPDELVEPVDSSEQALLPSLPADAVPVPADYDGDGATDLAFKAANGIWYIDLAANGFGGRWDQAYPGYGNAGAVPVPADYDGDGKADLAVKDASGMWGIDFASNHFGVWDQQVTGYGNATTIAVPADYDGDGKADLAIKTGEGGWLIDHASNGFTGWNLVVTGYGDASALPVPADYDGDGKADLAIKTGSGGWLIDYAANGFAGWNEIRTGYGGVDAVPAPADYDNDGKADLSVKNGNGTWFVDHAAGGFGGWNDSWGGRGGSWSRALPGDYDGDGKTDLAVVDSAGWWLIDRAADGFAGWNLQIDNVNRQLIDKNAPWIESTEIHGPNGKLTPVNGHYQLRIGVRYHAALRIRSGYTHYRAGIEVNPDLFVPASLNLINPVGSTGHVWITADHTRRYSLTCSEPGSFPLGFMMRDISAPAGTGNAFNKDYGIRVACTAEHTGLYGKVTARIRTADGRLVAGPAIGGAKVSSGAVTTYSDSNGNWRLPGLTGLQRIEVTKPGRAPTIAVNLRVPAAGLQLDTPLEEDFDALDAAGMKYTTYIDYSRGRTVLHTVRVPPASASVKLERSAVLGQEPNQTYERLVPAAAARGQAALAMVNGGYFVTSRTDTAHGYFYSRGYVKSAPLFGEGGYPSDDPSVVIEPVGYASMLTIDGVSTGQSFGLVHAPVDFNVASPAGWNQADGVPIWDVAPRDGLSDFDYGVQAAPIVLEGTRVVSADYGMAWARTAVALTAGGTMYLVVADGEGVNGAQGATFNQLGVFFRDHLGANRGLNLDGGHSTEMVLRGDQGPRRVNTITGEDSSWDVDPETQTIDVGVFNFVMAGRP